MTTYPDWLNVELFKEILIGATDLNLTITEAVPKGDHYFSTLLRVSVSFLTPECTPRTESFIIKAFPVGVMKDFMVKYGVMTREITMYKEVLPVFNQIANRKFSPICYEKSTTDFLILEDLYFNGFHMEDRIKQMDFNHCKYAVEALAEFHGASILYQKKHRNLIEKLGKECLYIDDNHYMKSFIINCFDVLGNEVKHWPESSKYSSKLLECGVEMWKKLIVAIQPQDTDILALNHGDFWTNNMLFRYGSLGEIEKVEFIDFQFCRWTNPGFDLQRFFYTTVRDFTDVSYLIDCYLNALNKFLATHTTTQISKEQLTECLDKMKCYAVIATVCMLPTCVRSRDKPLDYKEVTMDNYGDSFKSTNPYVEACKDKNYRKILPNMLDHFRETGIL